MEVFGSYRLEQTINVGSIGEIFLAWRQGDESDPVVVKRLHRELARRPVHVDLFIEEGRMAQRFSHLNLVHAFDAGTVEREGGERDHYIAMDLVRGPNLAQLAAHGAIRPRVVARIVSDLCAALEHMHESGVVHCDVSPTNILIGPERARLTDFGVTNPVGRRQPQARGTIAYMSPEQARGEPVDGRSDLFSLAVVAWELLAQRPLFMRRAPYLTLAAVVEDPVPDLEGDELADIEMVLRRALAKDTEARWSSATILADALVDALGEITRSLA